MNCNRDRCARTLLIVSLVTQVTGCARDTPIASRRTATPHHVARYHGFGATPPLYINVGERQFISENIDSGRLLRLSDGSLWLISPIDIISTALWLATSDVVVIEGDDPSYPFKIVSSDDNEVVNARLLRAR